MNKREAALWGYRLFLNREIGDEGAISEVVTNFLDAENLRRQLRRSVEFQSIMERAGDVLDPDLSVDWREGVLWAFRFFLRREPSIAEMAANLVENDTVNNLRLRILLTLECEINSPGLRPLADFAVVNAFAPFAERQPIAGVFQDIFGSVTNVRYLDHGWGNLGGHVYRSVPRHSEHGLHGTAEWIGTLRSVLEARGKFSAIELGAGWAPWLVVCKNAAAKRGITDIDLTGVEGSADHHAFMLDNFAANGIDPGAHALHHAVVGASDGTALFPKLHVATDDYGANAVFVEGEKAAAGHRGDLEEVRSLSLNTILAGKEHVNLIHIDIQGHEETVITAGMAALNAKVRRIVIGTHSRTIEGHLIDLLQDNGWFCEFETPCVMNKDREGKFVIVVDGEQVWRNQRF